MLGPRSNFSLALFGRSGRNRVRRVDVEEILGHIYVSIFVIIHRLCRIFDCEG